MDAHQICVRTMAPVMVQNMDNVSVKKTISEVVVNTKVCILITTVIHNLIQKIFQDIMSKYNINKS